jgi:hypothetical protein
MNADTVAEERTKKGGKYPSKVRFVVSKDGKTMTATAEGTDADDKKFSTRLVWGQTVGLPVGRSSEPCDFGFYLPLCFSRQSSKSLALC